MVDLAAPIGVVSKFLAKTLKPGRKIVSVVKFTGGRMEETIGEEIPAEVDAAVSVAQPVRGCPAPDFPASELKARTVLETFLSPEQREDFRRHNRFVSIGQMTGHRYMVTSRFARDELANYQRSLFDIDEGRPYCVHDWMVPAAEEMLGLHVLLQVGHEGYLRHLEG